MHSLICLPGVMWIKLWNCLEARMREQLFLGLLWLLLNNHALIEHIFLFWFSFFEFNYFILFFFYVIFIFYRIYFNFCQDFFKLLNSLDTWHDLIWAFNTCDRLNWHLTATSIQILTDINEMTNTKMKSILKRVDPNFQTLGVKIKVKSIRVPIIIFITHFYIS